MKLVTTEEAAQILGVDSHSLYRWIKDGKVPDGVLYKLPGCYRWDMDEFMKHIQQRSKGEEIGI